MYCTGSTVNLLAVSSPTDPIHTGKSLCLSFPSATSASTWESNENSGPENTGLRC